MASLDGYRVAILVSDDFEQSEFEEPKNALQGAGADVTVVSTVSGRVHGMRHDVKGDSFAVDMSITEAKPEEFDAVMLPGGALNADRLRVVREAQDFVRAMDEADKPIAAICHAPWLLASAHLVCGRTLTSYHTIQDDLRNAGGRWLNREMVRDRNWVTSRSPSDLEAFNTGMIQLFAESRRESSRRKAA